MFDVSSTIWQETLHTPQVLRETLDRKEGFDEALAVLRRPQTKRIIAIGNGASYYAAQSLWLASLAGRPGPEVVALPAGMLSTASVEFREGDVILALSVSGELRDFVEGLPRIPAGIPRVAVTSSTASSLARMSDAVATVATAPLHAATHTHSYCGAVATCLSLWSELTGDGKLSEALNHLGDSLRATLGETPAWSEKALADVDVPTAAFSFGPGSAWAAALESALLVKEIAQIPCEGVESREGSTSVMTTVQPGHLVLSIATDDDPTTVESEAVCEARGATVVRLGGSDGVDRRLSPITSFPAASAVALTLAARRGVSPDAPLWLQTYESTARTKTSTS